MQVFFLQAHLQVCLTSKVMTTVKLIVEPATEDQLTDLFVASFMADYKDEKSLCAFISLKLTSLHGLF